MPVKLYGSEHITYLVVFVVVFAAAIVVAQLVTKTEKQREILLRATGGVLLAFTFFNRIALSVWHKNAVWMLPNTYCGMSSLLLGACVLFGKPKMRIYDFLFYLELIGGLAAVFYPNFLGQASSIWFPPTISGLLHHSVGCILCVLLLQCKWFSPSLARWKEFPIGLCAYTVYGLFLLDVCGMTEAMQIDAPIISGTPLKWWFVLTVGSALLFVVLFCIEKVRAYRNNKVDSAKNTAPAPTNENNN